MSYVFEGCLELRLEDISCELVSVSATNMKRAEFDTLKIAIFGCTPLGTDLDQYLDYRCSRRKQVIASASLYMNDLWRKAFKLAYHECLSNV